MGILRRLSDDEHAPHTGGAFHATAAAAARGLLQGSPSRGSDLRESLMSSAASHGAATPTGTSTVSAAASYASPTPGQRLSHLSIPLEVDYETTFRAMTNRRLFRQYHGTHKPSRATFGFWTLAFLSIIAGFCTVSAQGTLAVRIDLSNVVIGLIIPLALLYVALRVVMVVRWCLFWLALGTVILVLLDDGNVRLRRLFSPPRRGHTMGARCCCLLSAARDCYLYLTRQVKVFNLQNVTHFADLFTNESWESICVIITMVALQVGNIAGVAG
jgi:hypothetical protein